MYTVISVMPFELRETKPMVPCEFIIPPVNERGDFNILHVNHGMRAIYLGEDKWLQVMVSDEHIAKSLKNDFCRAMLKASPEAHPGIDYLEGNLSKEEITKNHSDFLANLTKCQDKWFLELVQLADDDYSKTGMHKSISDLQRFAATSLGLTDRPWMSKLVTRTQKCKFCASAIAVEAIVCPVCTRDLLPSPSLSSSLSSPFSPSSLADKHSGGESLQKQLDVLS